MGFVVVSFSLCYHTWSAIFSLERVPPDRAKSLEGTYPTKKTRLLRVQAAISATMYHTIWLLPGCHLRSQVFGRIY